MSQPTQRGSSFSPKHSLSIKQRLTSWWMTNKQQTSVKIWNACSSCCTPTAQTVFVLCVFFFHFLTLINLFPKGVCNDMVHILLNKRNSIVFKAPTHRQSMKSHSSQRKCFQKRWMSRLRVNTFEENLTSIWRFWFLTISLLIFNQRWYVWVGSLDPNPDATLK